MLYLYVVWELYIVWEKKRWPIYYINDHIRPDGTGTLLMKVRGPNHRVKFVRQKKQTQYQWKANEKWILAVYHVQEFEISDDPDKIKEWPLDEKVELQLKKPKTEIEVHEAHNNS